MVRQCNDGAIVEELDDSDLDDSDLDDSDSDDCFG